MKFSAYDMAVCLCVDHRYYTEFPRVASLLQQWDTKVSSWIDGKGKLLRYDQYNQISPTPPPYWRHGHGAYAHLHGMKGIIRDAKNAGARHLLFVEDDLIFTEDAAEQLELSLSQLESEKLSWDVLYYGANHTEARFKELTPNVMQVYGSLTTHCMGIKASAFDPILELPEIHVIDNVIANRLHSRLNFLAVWPNVALQKPGFSYLNHTVTDYTKYFASRGGIS